MRALRFCQPKLPSVPDADGTRTAPARHAGPIWRRRNAHALPLSQPHAALIAAALAGAWLIAGCAPTQKTHDAASADPAHAPQAHTDASAATPAFSLPVAVIFSPAIATPRTKTYDITDGADRGGRLVREISPAAPDGSWSIATTLETKKGRTPTQLLRLSPTADGSVAMQSLTDLVKETIATFDPPLVLAPPMLTAGLGHSSESRITLKSTKDGSTLDSGTARANGVLTHTNIPPAAQSDDAASITLEILFELSSVDVRREAIYSLRGGQVSGEAESRTVKFGILTVERSRRVITLMP